MLRIRRRSVGTSLVALFLLVVGGLTGLALATGQAVRQLEIARLSVENRLLASSLEGLEVRAFTPNSCAVPSEAGLTATGP